MDGEERLRIPEGTQSGTGFRFRGKGVVNINGLGRGDQLVKVVVQTPTKLTRRQRELLESLDEELPSPSETVENEGFFEKVRDIFA
jgi:molecular chaperone DnaJ